MRERALPGPAPARLDFNEIIEAVNRARRARGLSAINAATMHGEAAAPFFALAEIFPVNTLARVEAEHEAWLATASPKEIAEGCPWRWWLKEPDAGSKRAAKRKPRMPVKPAEPVVEESAEDWERSENERSRDFRRLDVALKAVNSVRAEVGPIMHLSRTEVTNLVAYAEHTEETQPDPAKRIAEAHAAWIKKADDYVRRQSYPIAMWLKNPEGDLLRAAPVPDGQRDADGNLEMR